MVSSIMHAKVFTVRYLPHQVWAGSDIHGLGGICYTHFCSYTYSIHTYTRTHTQFHICNVSWSTVQLPSPCKSHEGTWDKIQDSVVNYCIRWNCPGIVLHFTVSSQHICILLCKQFNLCWSTQWFSTDKVVCIVCEHCTTSGQCLWPTVLHSMHLHFRIKLLFEWGCMVLYSNPN